MMLRVNVVMGGPSAEHEISLRSGLEVLTNIDRSKYRPAAVVVSRRKEFFLCDSNAPIKESDLAEPSLSGIFKGPFSPAGSSEIWEGCSVAFLALHGSFGEDGIIQGFLDTLGVPYTGSGVCASALAMDKVLSKYVFINCGLHVPPWSLYGKAYPDATAEAIEAKHGYPCFVKCPQSGSSRLLGRAGDRRSLEALLAELSRHAERLLVETSIAGIEFSCGVIENREGAAGALPPIEIRPKDVSKGGFFDFMAKYAEGGSEELVPAPRPPALINRIKTAALEAHQAIGCRGFSRTDFIYADDRLYVLETNTLPGLTSASLLPKEFCAAGGTYAGLIDAIIASALSKRAGSAA